MAIKLPDPGLGDGQTGDNEYVMWTKVKDNFADQSNAASRMVGEENGNLLEVGAFGLGGKRETHTANALASTKDGWLRLQGDHGGVIPETAYYYSGFSIKDGIGGTVLVTPSAAGGTTTARNMGYRFVTYAYNSNVLISAEIYTTENTTKDSNGFLKGKSPVTRLFNNRHEPQGNEPELKDIEFVKNGTGDYLLKNTTGLAKDGWYIELPQDANKNPLFAVIYNDDGNGNLSIKTYKRKFDFETVSIVADTDNPVDIPEGRWIDLRFNEFENDEVIDEPI